MEVAARKFVEFTKRGSARVDISGLDPLIRDMADLGKVARPELRKGMRAATKVVLVEAKRLVSLPTQEGRIYDLDDGEEHQASAPGDPPAKFHGLLFRSLKMQIGRSGLSGRVLSSDPKAHVQEYGSRHQEPRPFLRVALRNKADEVLRILEGAYRAGVARVFRSK